MLQTFRRKSDSSQIIAIKGNVPAGQAHARDGTVRHGVHITRDGALVEVESATPAPKRPDRPVELEIPVMAAADLAKFHDMRDGVYGLPVQWLTGQQAPIDVLVISVESKAWPGDAATVNQRFRATITLQPV